MDEARINGFSASLHPGAVKTELTRNVDESIIMKILKPLIYSLKLLFFKTPLEGAQTSLYTILEDEDKLVKGAYYENCQFCETQVHQAKNNEEC